MIQIPGFPELLFFTGLALWNLQIKKRSLMGGLFFDADFLTFFIFADKISRFTRFCLPIQNLISVALWEIPYLNWKYLKKNHVVRFSRDFCQNAWTLSLCAHWKNDAFGISAVVLSTRKTQVSLHNINSWISSILEIPVCILTLRNSCNVQLNLDHILWKVYLWIKTWGVSSSN